MKLLRHRDTEALLDGRRVADDSPLATVQSFLDDMRLEAAATPAPAPRPKLASTFESRRPIPRVTAPIPANTADQTVRSRAQSRLRSLAAAGAASVVLFGGLASANALPGPVQRASAELTSHFGLHLPGRTSPAPQHRHDTAPNATTPAPGSTIAPTHSPTGTRTHMTPTTTKSVITEPISPISPISPANPAPVTTTIPRVPAPTVTVPNLGGLPVPVTLPSIPLPIPGPSLPKTPIGHRGGSS